MFGNDMAYLKFANAAVVKITDSKKLFTYDVEPTKQVASDGKEYDMVPWGSSNDLPQQIIEKVGQSHDLSSNMLFNIQLGYGSGIIAARKLKPTLSNGEFSIAYEPVMDNVEINEFFENNDINGYLLEQLSDMNFFFNNFAEIILNQDAPASRKVVELRSKEAAFSRWTVMDAKGKINKHLYSAKWDDNATPEDVDVTDVLDYFNPVLDLKRKIGREKYANLKVKDDKIFRYVIPVDFPTPGRSYYNKPYWYALIESGWYDFALLIPELKKAMLENQMTIKYVVYLNDKYFDSIFAQENITEPEAKKARIKKEYENIQNFLSGAKNTGKASIGRITYTPDGKEIPNIKILPVENHFKGGDYIEDSEEVSNILAYGMGVHGSLIGSHGKSKTIAGTEARELFIIKQAIMKPMRDRILRPLYLIKAINKWQADIEFVIPNLTLTTLDKNTGSTKVVS